MDLGMHDGRDTAFYLREGYRVVAVDADPRQCEKARKLFKAAIEKDDLTVLNYGIGPTDGERTFYRSECDYWSSFDAGLAGRRDTKVQPITVPCMNPRFLLERYGLPYYMKVDIEGSDRCVIDAIAEFGVRPRYLSVELTHCDTIDAVEALGYEQFAVVDQSKFPKGVNPSGPFGEAITEWVSASEAHRLYAEGRQSQTSWFDLHAK